MKKDAGFKIAEAGPKRALFLGLLGGLIWLGAGDGLAGTPGTDLFQGFRQHIRAQIVKDKLEFSIADACTVWFYQHQDKKPRSEVEKVRYTFVQDIDPAQECLRRFPEGLEGARQGFGKAQQELSLSLTFFQMVLVGDGDDNEEYSLQETQDMVESLGLPFIKFQPVSQQLPRLTGLFDRMREEVQFKHLMEGMQTLMNKGYRFTKADQAGLNEELR